MLFGIKEVRLPRPRDDVGAWKKAEDSVGAMLPLWLWWLAGGIEELLAGFRMWFSLRYFFIAPLSEQRRCEA